MGKMTNNGGTQTTTRHRAIDSVEILTAEEAASWLRLDPATVYRLVNDGRIPAARIGRVWRFRHDVLVACSTTG